MSNKIVKYGDVVNWEDLDGLLGRLLTHIDATILDQVAREANKSIVKSIVREWMRDLDRHGVWGGLVAEAVMSDQNTATASVKGYTLGVDTSNIPSRNI